MSSADQPSTPPLPDRATAPAGGADPQPGPRPRPAGRENRTPTRPRDLAAVVDCAVYVDGRRQGPVDPEDALRVARDSGGFVWLGLYEPSEAELGTLSESYDLHPLAVEDAVFAHQRPKLERYDDALFMVLKTATYVAHEQLTATSEVVDTGEVMVFVGPQYVITVRHGHHGELGELRHRLEEHRELLRLGPAAVRHDASSRSSRLGAPDCREPFLAHGPAPTQGFGRRSPRGRSASRAPSPGVALRLRRRAGRDRRERRGGQPGLAATTAS